jgi:hypothetical protein
LVDQWSLSHFAWGSIFRRLFKQDYHTSVIAHELFELLENDKRFIDYYNSLNVGLTRAYEGDSILNTLGDLMCFHLGYQNS